MPVLDSVIATLNQVGGKTMDSHNTRFKARTSDMFSPEKTSKTPAKERISRHSSGKLQQRRLSHPVPSKGRRNSLSLPNGNGDSETPAPKQKKRTVLKQKGTTNTARSPLKKHGYNLQLNDNPKVNLVDSPAKNTRSQGHNPLRTLAQADLPPQKSSTKRQATSEGNATFPSSSAAAATKSSPRKRKVAEASGGDKDTAQGHAKRVRRDTREEVQEEGQDEDEHVDDGLQSQPEDEEPEEGRSKSKQNHREHVPDGEHDKDRSPQKEKKKPGRPRKSRETDQQRRQRLAEEQAAEVAEEERKALTTQKDRFVKDIEDVITINGCSDAWREYGGATYGIRQLGGRRTLVSLRVKALYRSADKLVAMHQKIQRQATVSSEQVDFMSEAIHAMEQRCELLVPTNCAEKDEGTILDLYRGLIPRMAFVLKSFLLARCKRPFLDISVLRELTHLLKVTLRIVQQAQDWKPQPTTLEAGIRRLLITGVRPNLKHLKDAFDSELVRHENADRGRLSILKLREKQIKALEVQRQRIEALSRTKREVESGMRSPRRVEHVVIIDNDTSAERDVYDVDDLEDQTLGDFAEEDVPAESAGEEDFPQESTEVVNVGEQTQGRGLVREPTIDIPPPLPVNLSEEEKMALLNGLQRYTGESRYSEILDDAEFGPFLKERDLDDLVTAARSFSQMMASKMGMEAYYADNSFAWLRSTDANLRDGGSVEL